MNLISLSYFTDIAETRSITAASNKNHITQQSMSSRLKKLEEEYQVTLFRRTTPLQLTEEGEILYAAAKEILKIHNEAVEQIGQLHGKAASLSVGIVFADAPPFLYEILSVYAELLGVRPNITLISNCLQVKEPRADVIFAIECALKDYQEFPLMQDSISVAVSASLMKKVYGDRTDEVTARMLESGDVSILKELPFARTNFGMYNGLYARLPDSTITTDNANLTVSLCIQGQAATIAPENYVLKQALPGSNLMLFPVKSDVIPSSLALYCRTDKIQQREIRLFLKACRKFFEEQANV